MCLKQARSFGDAKGCCFNKPANVVSDCFGETFKICSRGNGMQCLGMWFRKWGIGNGEIVEIAGNSTPIKAISSHLIGINSKHSTLFRTRDRVRGIDERDWENDNSAGGVIMLTSHTAYDGQTRRALACCFPGGKGGSDY